MLYERLAALEVSKTLIALQNMLIPLKTQIPLALKSLIYRLNARYLQLRFVCVFRRIDYMKPFIRLYPFLQGETPSLAMSYVGTQHAIQTKYM